MNAQSLNILDWILIGITIICSISCLLKGFIKEVMSAAAVILGLLGGMIFYRQAAVLLEKYVSLGSFAPFVGFIVVFIIVFLIMSFLKTALESIFSAMHLNSLDKVLGFVFGIAEGVIISSVILILLSNQKIIDLDNLLSSSQIANFMQPILTPIVTEQMEKFKAGAMLYSNMNINV